MMVKRISLCITAVISVMFAQWTLAAPVAEYWAMWDASNESNAKQVDHSPWDNLLGSYTVIEPESGIVYVRYGDFDTAAQKNLRNYIEGLAKIDPRGYSKLEQKAYWMNLYNALSVQAVLENFDTLKAAGFSERLDTRVLDKDRVKVAKEKLSLNDIEHRILRPIWKDHRVLFGLNCATHDCPNLSARAYTADNIKELLAAAGKRFINENSGVVYTDGVLYASRLFQDYLADFATDERMLRKVFAHYSQDMKALYMLGYKGDITYVTDSRLNMP